MLVNFFCLCSSTSACWTGKVWPGLSESRRLRKSGVRRLQRVKGEPEDLYSALVHSWPEIPIPISVASPPGDGALGVSAGTEAHPLSVTLTSLLWHRKGLALTKATNVQMKLRSGAYWFDVLYSCVIITDLLINVFFKEMIWTFEILPSVINVNLFILLKLNCLWKFFRNNSYIFSLVEPTTSKNWHKKIYFFYWDVFKPFIEIHTKNGQIFLLDINSINFDLLRELGFYSQ